MNTLLYLLNVSFDDEILNIVKQWIPYIEILKPVELQSK